MDKLKAMLNLTEKCGHFRRALSGKLDMECGIFMDSCWLGTVVEAVDTPVDKAKCCPNSKLHLVDLMDMEVQLEGLLEEPCIPERKIHFCD